MRSIFSSLTTNSSLIISSANIFIILLFLNSLFEFTFISANKNTWWNQLVPNIETQTAATWSVAEPTYQLTLGTSINKRKLKPDVSFTTTPTKDEKFWESKSFEDLLRDNQKDGIDDNFKPFKQTFKSWEYIKEDNQPARLIERSWENNDKNSHSPIEKRIESTVDDGKTNNNSNNNKIIQYGSKLNSNNIRWDDKIEFNEGPILSQIQNQIREEQKQNKEKQKKNQNQSNQITLRRSLETEDIPISKISKTSAKMNTVSPRLIKKSGIRRIQASATPSSKIEGRGRMWFKMPLTTVIDHNDQSSVTPQPYEIVDKTDIPRRKMKKKKIKIESQALVLAPTTTTSSPITEEPPRKPKNSYTFTWKKRNEDFERPTTENVPLEEEKPLRITEEFKSQPETNVEPENNDDNNDDDHFTEEELEAIRKFNKYQSEWEDDTRRVFREDTHTTTTTTEPTTTITSRPRSNRPRSSRRNQESSENTSAKEKSERRIIDYRTDIDHKDSKPSEPTSTVRPEVVLDEEIIVTERKPRRNRNKKIKKRIDDNNSVTIVKPELRKADLIDAVKEILYERDESLNNDNEQKAKQRAREPAEETTEQPARLEDVIPGVPEQDYGTLTTVPKTSFKCSDQKYPGYYGDIEAKCQVFHICEDGGKQSSFICPIGTVFNQKLFVCDWWNNFNCEETQSHFDLNQNLYKIPENKDTKPRNPRESIEELTTRSPKVDTATAGVMHEEAEEGESKKRPVYTPNRSTLDYYYPNSYDQRTIWTQIG